MTGWPKNKPNKLNTFKAVQITIWTAFSFVIPCLARNPYLQLFHTKGSGFRRNDNFVLSDSFHFSIFEANEIEFLCNSSYELSELTIFDFYDR